ncbi:MAG: hypothetical protein WC303_03490 [Candidatus Paceibacterota bacterium]|jgi:membrane-associated HD superfamily phosphohydrolase
MQTKKQSASWYIAMTHYLTSGFAIPFIMALILMFIIYPLTMSLFDLSETIMNLFIVLYLLLSISLGIIYSANYLKKTYAIDNKNKKTIVNISTIFFGLFYISVSIFTSGIYETITATIFTILFYLLSSKYILINSEN